MKCPACAEEVNVSTGPCPFCNEPLPTQQIQPKKMPNRATPVPQRSRFVITMGLIGMFIGQHRKNSIRLSAYAVASVILISVVFCCIHALAVSSDSPVRFESVKALAADAARQWQKPAVVLKTTGLFGFVDYQIVNEAALVQEDEHPQIVWEVAPDGYAPRHVSFYYDDKPVYIDEKEARIRFPYDAPPRPTESTPGNPDSTTQKTAVSNGEGEANTISGTEASPAKVDTNEPHVPFNGAWFSDKGGTTLTLERTGDSLSGDYETIVNERTGMTRGGQIVSGKVSGETATVTFGDSDDLNQGKPAHTATLHLEAGEPNPKITWEAEAATNFMPQECTLHRDNEVGQQTPSVADMQKGQDSEGILQGERFPETRLHVLTTEQVGHMNYAQVRYAINEMYARHGITFQNAEINRQFAQYPWYKSVPGQGQNETERLFSETERANLQPLNKRRDSLFSASKR